MLLRLNKIIFAKTAATSVVQSLIMKVLVIVLSLGCGMVTARALGPAGRGEQSAIVLWPYLISGLAGLGIAPAVTYSTSRLRLSEGSFLSAATTLTVLSGLAGALVGAIVAPFYLKRYSPEIVHAAQLTMLFGTAILVGNVFRADLEVRGKFTASNSSRIWPVLYTLVTLVMLWLVHRLTPFTSSLALFVPQVLQTAWLGRDLLHRFSFDVNSLLPDCRTLLSYGLRTYGTDVFYTLSTQVDQAFIISFLSPASLGLYSVALIASRQLNLVQISLNMVLLPKASALEFESAVELVGRMARISNLITGLGALVAIVVIPVAIPLFYGRPFGAAADITRILIGETFLMGVASVFAQAYNATGRPGIVSMFQGGWIVTSIVFLMVLIPRLGLIGAAVALFLSSLVRLLATLVCYPLVLHKPIPRLLPIVPDIKYLVAKARSYGRPQFQA